MTTKLYDANEDTNSRSPEWRLEVEGAEVCIAAGVCIAWKQGHQAAQRQQQAMRQTLHQPHAAQAAGLLNSTPLHEAPLDDSHPKLSLPTPPVPCCAVLYVLQEPLDVLVDDNFDWAVKELRASFVTSDKEAWALKFANSPAFERFLQKFNKAAFENRFGQEHNDDTVAKVGALSRNCKGSSDSPMAYTPQAVAGGPLCCSARRSADEMRPQGAERFLQ